MKLPNAERAVADIRKLRDYCLNMEHGEGKHKARVFAAALGLTAADAPVLLDAILRAAVANDARRAYDDEYGQRYVVDFVMSGRSGRVPVRSVWIIPPGEDTPRLTSCYIP